MKTYKTVEDRQDFIIPLLLHVPVLLSEYGTGSSAENYLSSESPICANEIRKYIDQNFSSPIPFYTYDEYQSRPIVLKDYVDSLKLLVPIQTLEGITFALYMKLQLDNYGSWEIIYERYPELLDDEALALLRKNKPFEEIRWPLREKLIFTENPIWLTDHYIPYCFGSTIFLPKIIDLILSKKWKDLSTFMTSYGLFSRSDTENKNINSKINLLQEQLSEVDLEENSLPLSRWEIIEKYILRIDDGDKKEIYYPFKVKNSNQFVIINLFMGGDNDLNVWSPEPEYFDRKKSETIKVITFEKLQEIRKECAINIKEMI